MRKASIIVTRTPTLKQYEMIRSLGVNAVCITDGARWNPLIKHGWVERLTDDHGAVLRITPDGLRAVAAAIEKHGRAQWPDDFYRPDVDRAREKAACS